MAMKSMNKWLRLGIVLYVVILAGVAVTSFAWFVFDDTTSLQTGENYMKIIGGDELYVAVLQDNKQPIEEGSYSQEFVLPSTPSSGEEDSVSGFGGFVYPDISGDGKTFYYPRFVQNEDGNKNTPPLDFTEGNYVVISSYENMSSYMVALRVGFRSASPMTVYLHNSSGVTGDSGEHGSIANAVRVAFVNPENSNSVYVWCPNEENPNDIGYLTQKDDEMLEIKYSTKDYLSRSVTLGNTQLATSGTSAPPMINNAPPIVTFYPSDFAAGGQGYVYKEAYIYIWVEGTDPDSHDGNKDQTLEYDLRFIGINKPITTYSLDDVTYDNGKLVYNGEGEPPTLNYSTDGVTWKKYSDILELNGAKNFYVRFAETQSTQPGHGEGYYKEFTS